MIVISLGWGVQSTTLAVMSALGDLPHADMAIHADTTHERSITYRYAEKMTPWLEAHRIHVVTVQAAETNPIDPYGGVMIPAMSATREGGVFHRQCTGKWKIAPMRRWLQANRNGEPVEMWLGISLDEVERAKLSDVKYITNTFPLLDRRMTRNDCQRYLSAHGLSVPPKSACVFCPYHNRAAWRELKETGNGDWHKALEVDEAIRKARPPYDLFVHSSRKPLAEVGDGIDAQPGFNLESEECSGVCFI